MSRGPKRKTISLKELLTDIPGITLPGFEANKRLARKLQMMKVGFCQFIRPSGSQCTQVATCKTPTRVTGLSYETQAWNHFEVLTCEGHKPKQTPI